MAKSFVKGKISNYVKLLSITFPNYYNEIRIISSYKDKIDNAKNTDELLGYEGYSSNIYFQVIKEEFSHLGFTKRIKRPPTDIVNSLLSFGYTILYSNVISILFSNGLNPYIGVFHTDSPNHASFASDIMEEFRAFAIDKVVIENLINNQFTTLDFDVQKDGAYYLNQNARKKYINLIEENLNKKFIHKESGFNTSLKRIIDLQVKSIMQIIYNKKHDYNYMEF